MNLTTRQSGFIKAIEDFIPKNVSLVNELAETLGISNDSAYRRIRGETSLTFDEIGTLCSKYKLSFDAFNVSHSKDEMVTFAYHSFDDTITRFHQYFIDLKEEIKIIRHASSDNKHILFAGQGIPIFHYLKFPKLTSFKMFYWMKSIMNISDYQNESYAPDKIDESLVQLGNEIFQHYLHIPSTEIWTDTTVLGTLHQVQFYWDSGMFQNKEDPLSICNEIRELLGYVQKTAAQSKKQDDFENPSQYGAPLQLYFSEIEFENNCIIVSVGDNKRVYLGQLSFGTLATENDHYYDETERWLKNILKKSNLISGVSDTMRFQFFKRSLRHLEKLEQRIAED